MKVKQDNTDTLVVKMHETEELLIDLELFLGT